MKDWSDDTSHHKLTFLPQRYICSKVIKDRSGNPSHNERTFLPQSYKQKWSIPLWRIDLTTHRTTLHVFKGDQFHYEGSIWRPIAPRYMCSKVINSTMKDRSDDPSHHATCVQRWSIPLWRIDPTTHRTTLHVFKGDQFHWSDCGKSWQWASGGLCVG